MEKELLQRQYNSDKRLAEKGMAIAGIIVGGGALAFCLFAYNWFTFLFGSIGLLISVLCCFSKKTNNSVTITSIVCSSTGLMVGILVSPEVFTSNLFFYVVRALILKSKEIVEIIRQGLQQCLMVFS